MRALLVLRKGTPHGSLFNEICRIFHRLDPGPAALFSGRNSRESRGSPIRRTGLAYSSGSIQRSTQQDGFVNVITGDNQTTGDRMILGGQDTLYLRLVNPSAAAPGDLFTIYKRTRKVFHPLTGQYLGHLVNRLAVAQVTQVDKDLTTVQILRTYGTVSPGDPVMKFVLPVYEGATDAQPSASDVEGRIVELQSDMGTMNLVAQGNVVYLDRGREDGIRAGIAWTSSGQEGNLPQRVVGK